MHTGFLFVVTLAALAGLLAGSFASCPHSSPSHGDAEEPHEARHQDVQQPCLRLRLAAEGEVRHGEAVNLTLTLENVCDEPVEAYLGGRPAYDFVVHRADGTEAWRWSYDSTIQQILEIRVLEPGEVAIFTATWEQQDNAGDPVPAGRYAVTGLVRGEPPQILQAGPLPLIVTP